MSVSGESSISNNKLRNKNKDTNSKRNAFDDNIDWKEKHDEKLYYKFNTRASRYINNGQEWYKKWAERSSAEYGNKVQKAIITMRYPDDDEDDYDDLDYETELPIDKDSWIPSRSDREQLATLAGEARKRRKARLFVAWRKEQMQINAEIKARNKIRDEQLAQRVKDNDHGPKKRLKVFGDVLNDMKQAARKRVQRYVWKPTQEELDYRGYSTVEELLDDGKYAVNIEDARIKADYLFLFRAVKATIVASAEMSSNKRVHDQERMRDRIKSHKHRPGTDIVEATDRLVDLFEEAELYGLKLSEREKRNYFMNMLDKELFKDDLKDYFDPMLENKFPDTFEALVETMLEKFELLPVTDPYAIRRWIGGGADRRAKKESSFHAIEEKSDQGDNRAHKQGRDRHRHRSRGHRNSKRGDRSSSRSRSSVSGESSISKGGGGVQHDVIICYDCGFPGHTRNKCTVPREMWIPVDTYKQGGKKADSSKSKSASTKEKVATKDKYEKVEKTMHVRECAMMCTETTISDKRALTKRRKGVRAGYVDFVLDTCAETGVAGVEDSSLMQNVKAENAVMVGITGDIVADEIGEIGKELFGKARICKDYKGSIIVSQYRLENMYQIVNDVKCGPIKLRGWPGTRWSGIEFVFVRNRRRYHDNLLHCTLKLEDVMSFTVNGSKVEKCEVECSKDRCGDYTVRNSTVLSVDHVTDCDISVSSTESVGCARKETAVKRWHIGRIAVLLVCALAVLVYATLFVVRGGICPSAGSVSVTESLRLRHVSSVRSWMVQVPDAETLTVAMNGGKLGVLHGELNW
jgi:hypothetical protein